MTKTMTDEEKMYLMRISAMFKSFSDGGEDVMITPDLSEDIAQSLLKIVQDNTAKIILAT